MNGESRSGVAHGYLCPCGKGAQHQCEACKRRICEWHSAMGPFATGGGILLKPVCLPDCDAPWWKSHGFIGVPR